MVGGNHCGAGGGLMAGWLLVAVVVEVLVVASTAGRGEQEKRKRVFFCFCVDFFFMIILDIFLAYMDGFNKSKRGFLLIKIKHKAWP